MGDLRNRRAWSAALAFAPALAALVPLGCATSTATQNIGPDHILATGTGLAIGSITDESPYANLPALLYRKAGSGGESYFQAARGSIIAAELPAGDYEVFSWRVTIEDGWVVAAKPFRVGFRVEPGKAIYFGNYDFHLETRALSHVASHAGNLTWAGDVACTDQSERDLRMFQARYPALPRPDRGAPQGCQANLGEGSRYHYQNLPMLDF
jgi:hypothetical protein